MKKNLTLALATTLAATTMLVGCNKPAEAVTVSSMKINGIVTAYMTEDTIEWDKLTVTATYSNKTTKTFTAIEFDTENPEAENCELVVYTSGLYSQATLQEGEYTIEAALRSELSKKYNLGKIVVGKITKEKYDLVSFDKPTALSVYQTNRENAGKEGENNFMLGEELFTVGTLNEFKFLPVAAFRNKENNKIIASDTYKKTVSLKEVTETGEVDASSSDYEETNLGLKFAETAAGKQFKLTVTPTEFDKTLGGATPVVTFEFKVEKGLNIYTAKELGALNLTHYNSTEFTKENGHNFSDHALTDGNGNIINRNGADEVFWNAEKNDYTAISYVDVWKKFLKDTGTFNDEQLVAFQDTPAIFLQNNIVLTPEDIPQEYFIIDGESANTNNARTGALRDEAVIYAPIIDGKNITINGNYLSLNTAEIPLCYSTSAVPGVNFYVFPKDYVGAVPPGHASLFKFCGLDADDDAYFAAQVDTSNGFHGIIKNISSVGNTSVVNIEQNDKIMEVTGLIFGKNVYTGGEYTNNLIKQYMIAVFPDLMVGQPYNGKEQRDNTFVRYSKIFDCSNSGIFNYHNGGALIEHSIFNRFGGAPVINSGCKEAQFYGITTFGEDVEFDNYITGEEVYFTAVGAASQFAMIKAWNLLFANIGNTFIVDGKMNLVSLNMDGQDYVQSPNRAYFGNVTLNKGSDDELKCELNDMTDPAWQLYMYIGTNYGQFAPVFKTEKGEVFFWDGVVEDETTHQPHPFLGPDQQPLTATLEGSYVSTLLPVGDTTLNAVFRIGKVTA